MPCQLLFFFWGATCMVQTQTTNARSSGYLCYKFCPRKWATNTCLFFSLSLSTQKKNTTAAPISVVQYKIQQKISRSFLWDYDHALCCHVVLSSKSRGSCYDMSSCQLLDFKWVSKELYVFSLKSFIFLFGSTLELKATKKENHGQNDHQIRHPS